MGTRLALVEQRFTIRPEHRGDALDAVLALASTGVTDDNVGTWFPGGASDPTFSYVHHRWTDAETLEEVLAAWRYTPLLDPADGTIVGLEFTGENVGDDGQLFTALAPYVEAGSYLGFEREDDRAFVYRFIARPNGTVTVVEEPARFFAGEGHR